MTYLYYYYHNSTENKLHPLKVLSRYVQKQILNTREYKGIYYKWNYGWRTYLSQEEQKQEYPVAYMCYKPEYDDMIFNP